MNTSDYYFCTSGQHRLPRPRPGLLIRFGVAPGLAGLPPLIQKGAAGKACEDNNWKLAVKLLELMPKRGLSPAASVWRKVLSTCCKNEKSRKATAILLDWGMHFGGRMENDLPCRASIGLLTNVFPFIRF